MVSWNPLPPAASDGDPNHTAHHNLLRSAAQQLQAEVDKRAEQTAVDAKNASQDTAIAGKADKSAVDAKNASQDSAIAGKADTSAVNTKNDSQDAAIAALPNKAYVDAGDAALQSQIDNLPSGGGGGEAASGSAYLSGGTESNMATWLAAKEAGVGDILVIGTSHPYGWGATDPGQDAWPWQLAQRLGATRGMEPLNKFSTEIVHKRPYITVTGAVARNYDSSVADNGSLDLKGAGTAITYAAQGCTGLRAITRDWGSGYKASVDGGTDTNMPSRGSASASLVTLASGLTAGDHTVTVKDSAGAADTDVRFMAMGGNGPGLVLHNFGVPGSNSVQWRSSTGSQPAWMLNGVTPKEPQVNSDTGQPWASLRTSVGAILPALLIIQIGGGNDTRDAIDAATYAQQLDYIIKWSRGQHTGQTPRSQAIITLTPVGDTPEQVAIREEAWRVCADNDVPVFDLETMIPYNSPLYTGDGHFTTAGHTLIADEMAKAVTNPTAEQYATREYVDAQDAALQTQIDNLPSGGALDWLNVKAGGNVKGDGTTDDTAAIQAVLNTAGVGSTVYFPKGTYMVSYPLKPLRQQRLVGCHSPKYDPAEYPTTSCAIRATAGFTGTAILQYDNAPGVTIESLCLLGKGQTASGGLNGIDMGASNSGEKQWWIKSCTLSAFDGAGITGSLWVGDIRDTHIGRCGYGIRTKNAEAWTDVRVIGTQIYFCTNGGIEFDTTKRTGLVTLIGTRVERSGGTYGSPGTPLNINAFGIRLGNANNIELIGVSTDSCSGPGLWIGTDVTDSSKIVYSVIVTGSEFLRDGGGEQTGATSLPGVRLRGCSHVQFVGNTIGYGAHDDSNPGQLSPKYGLELEKATQCQVGYSRVETAVFADSLNIVGTANHGTAINLQPHGLFSFPVANEAARPAKPLTGSSYYSTTDQKPRWWTGTKWVDALNGDGVYAPTMSPGLDLEGADTVGKTLRFRVGQFARWVLSLRTSSQSSNFTLDRHDDTGTYVDTPLTVRASDGRIDTNPQYVTAKQANQIPLEVRPAASPSVSWFKVSDATGISKFEVIWDGGTRAGWGSTAFAQVQLGCTQVVREGVGSGSTLFAAYTSVANANADSSVFEVYGSGRVKGTAATNSNEFTTKAQVDAKWTKWTGTQAEYDALGTYDANTLYVVTA